MEFSRREQHLLLILLEHDYLPSSEIHAQMVKKRLDDISLITVKRALSNMMKRGLLVSVGAGPATKYAIAPRGRIFMPIDAKAYCTIEPDKRSGQKRYNFDLFATLPSALFSHTENLALQSATEQYHKHSENLSETLAKKELERLIIELSWKSSRIEGNTYTLLDTEKLILEHLEAPGHDRKEARMILNHKDAFTFVRDQSAEFQTLTRINLEKLHSILVKDMDVAFSLREKPVGVTGSLYRPLDNIHQLREGVAALSAAVTRMATPFGKALIALLGISYLQPFEDGNKRTARLMANALLLAHNCAPLSYRSVDENEYREAMLVFYEINSIMPFKQLFLDQYEFAAANYTIR